MRPFAGILLAAALVAGHARAQEQRHIGYAEVLNLAVNVSPTMRVARAEEHVIASDVSIAGVIANPTFIGGTSTQAAKISVGVSVPLAILGQRGAAIRAGQAGLDAAHVSGRRDPSEPGRRRRETDRTSAAKTTRRLRWPPSTVGQKVAGAMRPAVRAPLRRGLA